MYKELISGGWVDTRLSFADLAILAKGRERLLFDKKGDTIYMRYKF